MSKGAVGLGVLIAAAFACGGLAVVGIESGETWGMVFGGFLVLAWLVICLAAINVDKIKDVGGGS